ncbi:MAG: DUF2339 domain-containing protein, partial [Undibacterium sp.]|nr:DUF2339 domain-containing protein [Undibacterium sp.]
MERGDHNLFLYVVGGTGIGLLLKLLVDRTLEKLQQSNATLHQQAAVVIKDLRTTLARLEGRLKELEAQVLENTGKLDRTQIPISTTAESSSIPKDLAEIDSSLESLPQTLPKTSLVEPLPSELLHLAPEVESAPLPQLAKEEKLALPDLPEEGTSISVPDATSIKNTSAAIPVAPQPSLTFTTAKQIKLPPPPPAKHWRERLPKPLADFIFGVNTLVKLGVLILFLGLAFLLRYAAEHTTVPIELRYVGVAATGLVLLILGWRLRHKRMDYALILQGMAIGVFYITMLGAIRVHHLITPEIGFAFLFLVSVLSAALAVLQRAPNLAIVAALAGFVSPVLTSTGANNPMGLFTYLTVLDLGIFCVAWFNAWRVLNVIAFVGTFSLSLGWAHKWYADSDYALVQPFLLFFFVLFAVIGVLFARRTLLEARQEASLARAVDKSLSRLKLVGRVDSALVFGNPITAFGLQYILVKHIEFGAAFSALAMAFFYLILARLIYAKEKQGLALLAEAYLIVAAIFGTLAIPLGLEGTWTGAAWAVEGAGMYWLGVRQGRPY